ncbi:MAG: hypothetical protein KGL73_11940 [Burkholderiales bacterium]|nr:hypothetical protein [Burkholderiales bacterium]
METILARVRERRVSGDAPGLQEIEQGADIRVGLFALALLPVVFVAARWKLAAYALGAGLAAFVPGPGRAAGD